MARQVNVDPAVFGGYDWSGRSIKYHRARIRKEHGFREATRGDEAKLTRWLAEEVAPSELSDERLREALLGRCRAERIDRRVGSSGSWLVLVPPPPRRSATGHSIVSPTTSPPGWRPSSTTTHRGVAAEAGSWAS